MATTGVASGGIALGQVSPPSEADEVWFGAGAAGLGAGPAPGAGVGVGTVGGAIEGSAGDVVAGVTA